MFETNESLFCIDLLCLYLYMYIGARGVNRRDGSSLVAVPVVTPFDAVSTRRWHCSSWACGAQWASIPSSLLGSIVHFCNQIYVVNLIRNTPPWIVDVQLLCIFL
jgi:hypothetical protein